MFQTMKTATEPSAQVSERGSHVTEHQKHMWYVACTTAKPEPITENLEVDA